MGSGEWGVGRSAVDRPSALYPFPISHSPFPLGSDPQGLTPSRHADARVASRRDHQLGDGPDQGVEAVWALAVAQAVGGEVAHLAFQFRELADVDHAALA